MDNFTDIEIFDLLKKDITKRFFESNSASSIDISTWKGQDITSFQEDIFAKTKSTVSEKWFYTYFKSDFKKLPRIDMLNLLAQYAGYQNWNDFVKNKNDEFYEHQSTTQIESVESDTEKTQEAPKEIYTEQNIINEPTPKDTEPVNTNSENAIYTSSSSSKKAWIGSLLILSLLIIVGVGIYFGFFYQKKFEFCFIDSDRNMLIKDPIEIKILRKGFTPLELVTSTGCIEFSSFEDTLQMYVSSPYHKVDTFRINLHQYQNQESIRLEPDDYKVMLRHYSKSSQSVKERISMLDKMIADDALIYQVYDNEYFGVEILNKKQYINLVSLPTSSLKNFTLIEADRKNGKIVKIKFKIQSNEE